MNKACIFLAAATPALLTVASCGQALMQPEAGVPDPVVECYLEEGKNLIRLKVYTLEEYIGEDFVLSKPVAGLQPRVNDRTLEETSPGSYALDLGEDTIRGGQEFRLGFSYEGRQVSAVTVAPSPPTGLKIEPSTIVFSAWGAYFGASAEDTTEIVLSWEDPGGDFYQLYIVSPGSSTVNTSSGPVPGRRMMQPFRGNRQVLRPMDFPAAGYYTIYLYRVNKDYAELYERISSTDLANPVSFVENAMGVFTSLSVARTGFTVTEE
ncbi:MAG: hypothetical protein LBD89_00510 [Tannerellaceae bacterium]|jgi:hypothetical protein|nr:hypothetical protein [Tannerellaceae bacterium]